MNAIATAKTNGRTASNERLSRLGLLKEPAGYVDGQNLYQYVGGNPATQVDPLGLEGATTHPSDDPSFVTTVAAGIALGEATTIGGRTSVRINGTNFFITGNSNGLPGVPKTGSTSVLFIVKKSDPSKMYRLDYDVLKQGANAGQKGWEHNQKGVAQILKLSVTNHQPAGTAGKAAGQAITVFKRAGKALWVVGAVSSAVDIYNAENKPREIVAQAGGWAAAGGGAALGAKGGAWVGGGIGVWFGGVGTAPGAVIGGIVGGVGGAIGGFWVGHKIVTTVWDWVFTPLEKEEYIVVECPPEAATQPTTQFG